MTLYYLGNARSEDQRQEMIALEAAGICIFCPSAYSHDHTQREVLLDYNTGVSYKKQVLASNGTWVVLRNEYPYPGASQHLLVVPRVHITRMDQLPPASRTGFWEILDQVADSYGGTEYYVMGIRNGDMRYTAGTIAHLHIQFLVGDPNNTGEPLKLFASSRPNDPSSV